MKEKLKMYLPIIVMLIIALTAGILIWLDILHVDQIIAAVNDNRPLAALVILALFAFKGCSCIPYAVILIGCALIFELPVAIAINTVGTVICISVSYLIGRFSKGLTFDRDDGKVPEISTVFFPMLRDIALPLCFLCIRCIFRPRCRASFSDFCAHLTGRMSAAQWRRLYPVCLSIRS